MHVEVEVLETNVYREGWGEGIYAWTVASIAGWFELLVATGTAVTFSVCADDSMLESFRERRPSTNSQVSLDEQIDFLQEKLQMIQSQSGFARKRKEKSLRRELTALRRQMRNERKVSGEQGRPCRGGWVYGNSQLACLFLGTYRKGVRGGGGGGGGAVWGSTHCDS